MKTFHTVSSIFVSSLGLLLITGCILLEFIPAKSRSFNSEDLLLSKSDISENWNIHSGPRIVHSTSVPPGTMEISFSKVINSEKWDFIEYSSLFSSVESAKKAFREESLFPGNIIINQWTFSSNFADEEKFSCYKYSNMDIPVCRWLVRYEEIFIELIAWVSPDRITYSELQEFAATIDKKVSEKITTKVFPIP